MKNKYGEVRVSIPRIIGMVLCILAVFAMFFDWVNFVLLDKISSKIKIFDFLESRFTLLEITDIMKKFEALFGGNIKNIVTVIVVFEIISIFSICILFVCMLFAKAKFIKIYSVISLITTFSMFGSFMYSLNKINSKGAEMGERYKELVQSTIWPYVMLVAVTIVVVISFTIIAKEKKSVSTESAKES